MTVNSGSPSRRIAENGTRGTRPRYRQVSRSLVRAVPRPALALSRTDLRLDSRHDHLSPSFLARAVAWGLIPEQIT